jgi:hypothetical protein
MPSNPKPRFVRFVTTEIHTRSKRELGVFHAVRYIRDDGGLNRREERAANAVFAWLAAHLDAPPPALLRKQPGAISWFRVEATEHIAMAERLTRILTARGVAVRRLDRVRPGRIIFADSHQVFALPRRVLP